MTDWATISAFATGAGTLVLAGATFSSVRASNRSARLAERTLLASLRPFLIGGRLDDPIEKIRWGDGHWASVGQGRSVVEVGDDSVYLAMPLRNSGAGIAVLQGWVVRFDQPGRNGGILAPPALDDFVPQGRDLYIAPGDSGFWQAAVRDDHHGHRQELLDVLARREVFSVCVLYSDAEGGQRTISRFALSPKGEDAWLAAVVKHWHVDREGPR